MGLVARYTAVCIVLIALVGIQGCEDTAPKGKGRPSPSDSSFPLSSSTDTTAVSAEDSAAVTHLARVHTTKGNFTIALYGNDAPRAVNNFIALARKGKYNKVLFHRVAKDFVVQTGDPKTRSSRKRDEWGTGGESIYGKPFEDELHATSPSYQAGYTRGTVAMANNGPNTNTSQFFVCIVDIPDLARNFTIFGKVIDGMAAIDSIGNTEIEPLVDATDGIPMEPIAIRSVKISTYRKKP